MANLTLPTTDFRGMAKSLRAMGEVVSEQELSKGYMKSMANIMLNLIALRFAKSEDANKQKWVSSASKTKLSGRFSVNYKKRPSGKAVSGSSKRLFDTGALMRSYKVYHITGKKVIIGPTGKRNTIIAEAMFEQGNYIAGWGKEDVKLANKELEAYILRTLKGKV